MENIIMNINKLYFLNILLNLYSLGSIKNREKSKKNKLIMTLYRKTKKTKIEILIVIIIESLMALVIEKNFIESTEISSRFIT